MEVSDYLSQPGVEEAISEAHHLKSSGKRFSDLVDDSGFQYVDLVQEGSGVLGIALIGYTFILEEAGIRFFNIAGTSAGAINSILLAGLGNICSHKSVKILKILNDKNLFDLVDGDTKIKRAIQRVIHKDKWAKWGLIFNAWRIARILRKKIGLNPGRDFISWMEKTLKDENINTVHDLERLRAQIPAGLKHLGGDELTNLLPRLAIITSDVTTHTKVELPRMSELYWEDPQSVSPAEFVRASMSVPYFFEPFTKKNIPDAGLTAHIKWIELAGYHGTIPSDAKFVDGGLLSNFPINAFHRRDGGIPMKPTFGVRLSTYRAKCSKTNGFWGLGGAILNTMRQIHDYDFLLRHPDYKYLICGLDADGSYNWLDFNMRDQDKMELFKLGVKKGLAFLNHFDWKNYKISRQRLQSNNVELETI